MCPFDVTESIAAVQHAGLVAFYYPDKEEQWDRVCGCAFLGNFYPSAVRVGDRNYLNAEAAYQAQKYLKSGAKYVHQFEKSTGNQAFLLKKKLKSLADHRFGDHGSNWAAMYAVLQAKFAPGSYMAALLTQTCDAFLLEHNSTPGRDRKWSDDADGSGQNWLGMQLMLIREELSGRNVWTPIIRQSWPGEVGRDDPTEPWLGLVQYAAEELNSHLSPPRSGKARCARPLCPEESWNGLQGEYCSLDCKEVMTGGGEGYVGRGRAQAQAGGHHSPLSANPGAGHGSLPPITEVDELPSWATSHVGQERHEGERRFQVSRQMNETICLWLGSITRLRVDAIVNAANEELWAGGGICGAIHSAAGPDLATECNAIRHCPTGQTVITCGYRLPAKHVLHTVGPTTQDSDALASAYKTTLDLALEKGLKSVALCCVSTGIFGFPLEDATHIALRTVRQWLEDHPPPETVPRIVFVMFKEHEEAIYKKLLLSYFPLPTTDDAA